MNADKAAICKKAFSVAQINDTIRLDYTYPYTRSDGSLFCEYNSSTDFCESEFKEFLKILGLERPATIERLCKKIHKDKYDIKINAKKNTIAWLNGLLRIPNFYDILTNKKKKDFSRYKNIMDLVEKTNEYRHKQVWDLSHNKVENIKKLNRLLLEATYPENTPVFIPRCLTDNIHFKGSPVFTALEFVPPLTVENLCKVINDNNYGSPSINDIGLINKLLRVPDLYNRIYQKKQDMQFSSNIKELVALTNEYRDKYFLSLSQFEQGNILWLNRFLLQELYPQETPVMKNRAEYEIFIKLEHVLDEGILRKIRKLNSPNKCVLITGTDDDLILGVVSYIYFTHCCKKLYYYDCLNWDIQRFKTVILAEEEGVYYFFNGNTLYLRSPEGSTIFKELAREIRDYFIKDYGEKTSHGMLIISMHSTDNLPEEFIKLFEIIEIDTNKQRESLALSHTASQSNINICENKFLWCSGTWEITYEKKIIRPPEYNGLTIIHYLICNANKEFTGLELMKLVGSRQSEENKQVLLQRGKQVEYDELDERLPEGIPPKKLKKRLDWLYQKLESAETLEDEEVIQNKIDETICDIESIQGENSANNARLAVYNAISRVLEKIKQEYKHPSLYEHLELSIKTGNAFKYEPKKATQWILK